MNPEAIVAHIRANAEGIARMSVNVELTGTTVSEFCTWVEAQLKPQAPGYAAGGHAAVHASPENPPLSENKLDASPQNPVPPPQPEVKKEKVIGDHNLHGPRR